MVPLDLTHSQTLAAPHWCETLRNVTKCESYSLKEVSGSVRRKDDTARQPTAAPLATSVD